MTRPFPLPRTLPSKPLKPYIRPDKRERKAMTIAAGFRCSDGIVLCADSQMTALPDGMKYNAKKIFSYSGDEVDSAFAFAGSETFSKMCIERLAGIVSTANPSNLESKLHTEALAIHQEYAPQATEHATEYNLAILAAIRHHGGKANLYHIEGPAVSPKIDTYDCLGIGRTVARQAISLFHKDGQSVWETVRVAVYCLAQTKDHIEACGGPSQITALWDDDSIPTMPYDFEQNDILDIEKGFSTLFNTLRPVFLSFNDTSPAYLSEFNSHLRSATRALKQAWKKEANKARRLEAKRQKELDKFLAERNKTKKS